MITLGHSNKTVNSPQELAPPDAEVVDAKSAILKAARSQFAAKGFAGARIKDIAQAADINAQAIYYYFESKEGLYLATLEDSYADIRGNFHQQDSAESSPILEMIKFVENFFDGIAENREIVDLVADENRQKGVHLSQSPYIREVNIPFVQRFREILEKGIKGGMFRPDLEPLQTWISVISLSQFYLSNSFTLSHIVGYSVDSKEQIKIRRKHVTDFFMAGILITSNSKASVGCAI